MIQSEALSRVRNILNETTAGFWTDAQLYQYLDSGMNIAIQHTLGVLEAKKKENKYSGSIVLQPLHTLDSSNTTVAGTQEYSLPSDFLITDFCDYTPDDRVNGVLPCVLIDYAKMRFENTNTYLVYTANNPAYYIRDSKIGFFPIPVTGGAGANRYNHYYYKKPTTITSGTASSEIPIKLESHEAVIYFAVHLACLQDFRPEDSANYYKYGIDILTKLG